MSGLNLPRSCACCHNHCTCICPVLSRKHWFLVWHTAPLTLISFSPSLLFWRSLRLSGGVWYRHFIESWVFHSLLFSACWPALGLCATEIYCKQQLLWWRLNENVLIFGYSHESSAVIIILCPFSRTKAGCPSGPQKPLVLSLINSTKHKFYLVEQALNPKSVVGYSHNVHAAIAQWLVLPCQTWR